MAALLVSRSCSMEFKAIYKILQIQKTWPNFFYRQILDKLGTFFKVMTLFELPQTELKNFWSDFFFCSAGLYKHRCASFIWQKNQLFIQYNLAKWFSVPNKTKWLVRMLGRECEILYFLFNCWSKEQFIEKNLLLVPKKHGSISSHFQFHFFSFAFL